MWFLFSQQTSRTNFFKVLCFIFWWIVSHIPCQLWEFIKEAGLTLWYSPWRQESVLQPGIGSVQGHTLCTPITAGKPAIGGLWHFWKYASKAIQTNSRTQSIAICCLYPTSFFKQSTNLLSPTRGYTHCQQRITCYPCHNRHYNLSLYTGVWAQISSLAFFMCVWFVQWKGLPVHSAYKTFEELCFIHQKMEKCLVGEGQFLQKKGVWVNLTWPCLMSNFGLGCLFLEFLPSK